MKHLSAPVLEMKELGEMMEQWRRSKLAWLCKELSAHKTLTSVRILNAQNKWLTQEDTTLKRYVFLRREEEEVEGGGRGGGGRANMG
ncbi:hypothetical protein G4B88_000618 [Cannabis sativa]|uniref:Uncharacterized protein n=1 Tax=Cannabis sativa TaxID=3483 RepID=A0A7J6DL99_CANSA|nr:hypothetical protein G4B88_000618 [Cannabis sativa]